MASKKVRVAPATTTDWSTLPGSSADLRITADMIEDTIFGAAFKSEFPDAISWEIGSNAVYKGYSGYSAIIRKGGTPTAMTDEAMSLVSGKTYVVTAATKRIIDFATAVVVEDNNVDRTTEVESIDFMFGTVTFKSTYTVTGAVTITAAYIPASQICAMNKYSLTQTAEAVDTTDLCIAQANNGARQFAMGIKTVGLELSGFYKTTSGFMDVVKNRSKLVIDVNPDGAGKSICRGVFVAKDNKQSGKVGNPEEDSVSFSLYVPDNALMASPFSWYHDATTTLNLGVRTLLAAWQDGALVESRYLEDGTTGKQGSALPTSLSLSGGLGALNEFSVQLKGSGAISSV